MRFSGLLFLWLWAVLVVLTAQEDAKYFEVGTTLSLEPDPPAVKHPVKSIRWKHGTNLVVDWPPENPTYYGTFRERTTLDPKTLRLDINGLTMNDSGQFTLETDKGTVGTYEVKVIKPPPTPTIRTQPLVCNGNCTLKCIADTQDLGPVTYEWKEDEGEWTKGDRLKNINSSDTTEKFLCRLRTHVRPSHSSMPMANPLYKPQSVNALVKFGPDLQLSTSILQNDFLKKCIVWQNPPATPVGQDKEENGPFLPSSTVNPVPPADPDQPEDGVQPDGGVQPANGVSAKGDLEMGTLNNPDSNEDK